MSDRLALRPNLSECMLEDRTLLVAPPGLLPNPFFTINPFTNQFVVPGGISSGGGTTVGPQYFYLTIGAAAINSGFNATGGPSGEFRSIYGLNFGTNTGGASVAIGSGANGGGGGGGSANTGAFSASFSSGYNTSLNATNNFGMTGSSLGSVPVHSYDDAGTPAQTAGGSDSSSMSTAQGTGSTTPDASNGSTTGTASLGDRLLGRRLGKPNSLISGPSTSSGSTTP